MKKAHFTAIGLSVLMMWGYGSKKITKTGHAFAAPAAMVQPMEFPEYAETECLEEVATINNGLRKMLGDPNLGENSRKDAREKIKLLRELGGPKAICAPPEREALMNTYREIMSNRSVAGQPSSTPSDPQ